MDALSRLRGTNVLFRYFLSGGPQELGSGEPKLIFNEPLDFVLFCPWRNESENALLLPKWREVYLRHPHLSRFPVILWPKKGSSSTYPDLYSYVVQSGINTSLAVAREFEGLFRTIINRPRPRIFMSHSHSDRPFVQRLGAKLNALGIDVWVDDAEIKLGDSLIEKIREGIDSSDFFAAIISAQSVKSKWVKLELDVAMTQEIEGRRVKVLPLLIEDCDLPGFLIGKLYADFRPGADHETALARLLARLAEVEKPVPRLSGRGDR